MAGRSSCGCQGARKLCETRGASSSARGAQALEPGAEGLRLLRHGGERIDRSLGMVAHGVAEQAQRSGYGLGLDRAVEQLVGVDGRVNRRHGAPPAPWLELPVNDMREGQTLATRVQPVRRRILLFGGLSGRLHRSPGRIGRPGLLPMRVNLQMSDL